MDPTQVAGSTHVGGRYVRRTKERYELHGVKFKSRYEYNFACFQDYLGIPWLYEPHTFHFPVQRGTVSYRPDFYLPKARQFVETKGYWDRRSLVQQKRMKMYFPDVSILIVDEPFFSQVERQRQPGITRYRRWRHQPKPSGT